MTLSLQPIGDRIIVSVFKAETQTQSGIVIPDQAAEKPQQAKVIAVGTGKYTQKGDFVPLSVNKGDRVMFARTQGETIKWQDEEFVVLRESDIVAVIKE